MRLILPVLLLLVSSTSLPAQQVVELPARDRALPGAPATVLTFGREEGEPWELLSSVSGVDFDGRDNLYILDAGSHRVLVLDAGGSLLRTIGKRGGGPGELLSPTALAVLPDGSLAVADLGRGAFSIFGPDGAFRYNLPFADTLGQPLPEQRGNPPSVQPHPAGLAVGGALRMAIGGPGSGSPQPPTTLPVYLRPLAEKDAPRVLYRIPREAPVMRVSGSERNRSVRSVPRAFTPAPGWALLPDGGLVVLHGDAPEYRLHVVGPDGRLRRTLTRPLAPRRVGRADQQRAREQLAERLRSGTGMVRVQVEAGPGGVNRSISTGGGGRGPSEEEIQEQVRALEFAPVIPAVSGVRTDPQGRIWVARAPRRVGDDGPIDLLTADGRYLGTLAPQPLPDAISRSGLAAYITRDELGVERVVVKRLPAGWR